MRGDPHQRARHAQRASTRARAPTSPSSCASPPTRRPRPASVMGASKWVAEQIVLRHAPRDDGVLLGALRQRAREPRQRDPDVPAADRRRRAGHRHRPAMTRYFMSTDEAVRLVLLGAALGGDHRGAVVGVLGPRPPAHPPRDDRPGPFERRGAHVAAGAAGEAGEQRMTFAVARVGAEQDPRHTSSTPGFDADLDSGAFSESSDGSTPVMPEV